MSQEIHISSIATKIGSGSTPRGGKSSYLPSGIPFIRSQNVQFGHLEMSNATFIGQDVHAKMKGTHVKPGDVLLNITGASIGRSAVVPKSIEEANVNQHVCIIRVDNSKYHPKFLSEFLNSKKGQYLIDAAQSGGSRQGLNFQEVGRLKIPNFGYDNQQKIAEILSDCDTAIEALARNIDKTSAALSAVVRKLFNPYVCGSKLEETNLSKCALGDLFVERNETDWGDLPLASITMDKGVIPRDEVGRKDSSSEDKSKYKKIASGDIGYNTMRMWQGVSGLSELTGIVSPAYTICIPKKDQINPEWAAILFKEKRMIFEFWRHSQGLVNDTLGLKFKAFSEIKIRMPDMNRQMNDVSKVESFNAHIEMAESQIAALKKQKRGLMQQLLTGKLRIKATA